MSRNKNLLPIIVLSAVVLGSLALSAYEQSHPSGQPASQSNAAIPINPANTYPDAIVPELATATCHANGVLPDPVCTPGVTNPNVTQANIQQTICVSGFTSTIRPPTSYTNRLKAEQMTAYGYSDSIHLHEEDHLISLELGGSPNDPKNLWPEPDASPNPKDKVENYLHTAICAGRIALHDAQVRIATDWTTAEVGL